MFSTGLDNFLPFFVKFEIVVCKVFQFWRVQNLSSGNGLKKCYNWLCLQSIICKYRPVSTKLGQNIYVQQNLSLIIGPIGPEQLELFALELGKIAAVNFAYSLASSNINQSASNLVTMYMSIRFQMSLIMGQVIPDQWVLEKFNFSSLFGIYLHC